MIGTNDPLSLLKICCHNAAPAKMTGNLELTQKGVPDQLVAKAEGPSNYWVFEVKQAFYDWLFDFVLLIISHHFMFIFFDIPITLYLASKPLVHAKEVPN